jgi:hypothetical protein
MVFKTSCSKFVDVALDDGFTASVFLKNFSEHFITGYVYNLNWLVIDAASKEQYFLRDL